VSLIELYASATYKSAFGLAMTLTYDLLPRELFQQCLRDKYLCQVPLKSFYYALRYRITRNSR